VRFSDLLGDGPEPEPEGEEDVAPSPPPAASVLAGPTTGEAEPPEPSDFAGKEVPWELEPLESPGPGDEELVPAEPLPEAPLRSQLSALSAEPAAEPELDDPEPAEIADHTSIDDTFLPSRKRRGR